MTRVNFIMHLLAIPLLLVVGALLALQAAANVQLSARVGSPAGGATLQLAVGVVALLLATLAAGTVAALGLLAHATPWHLVGGAASALYISAGIVLFPRLGAVVTVGLFIAGQMLAGQQLASVLVDRHGWLRLPRRAVTPARLAGVAVLLAGVALIQVG